jgi:hypothetical protein
MLGVTYVCVFLGLLALLLAFSRWLAHRPWAAAGNAAVGVTLLLVAHHLWPAVVNLRTYETMPASGPVAQLFMERTGGRTWRVTLTRLPAGRMQVFQVSGDQWRLDARALFWSERATKLGLRPAYRLDRLAVRLSGKPADAADDTGAGDEPTGASAGFALADAEEPGEDVWAQARTGARWPRDLQATHLYGPWQRLADGARFAVWVEQLPSRKEARLEVRAVNEAAGKALGYTPPRP